MTGPASLMTPALQAILDAELTRGNTILSVGEWPPDCRLVVQLARPFRKRHPAPPGIVYAALNDPHYWKADYHTADHAECLACGF